MAKNLIGIALLCFTNNALNSQVDSSILIDKTLLDVSRREVCQKKKSKVVLEFTIYDTLRDGSTIPRTRVPKAKIKSPSKQQITDLQEQLDLANGATQGGVHLKNLQLIQDKITLVETSDQDWPTSFYQLEFQYFKIYEAQLTQEETLRRATRRNKLEEDSVRFAQQMVEIRRQDQLRRTRDSLAMVERDSVAGRLTKPATQSPTVTPAPMPKALIGSDTQPAGSNPKTGRRYESHRYYRGPRGGCYYINADGNKVYVDRSLCD